MVVLRPYLLYFCLLQSP